MVQPKYSPEEALHRVKLMMGYDTKKTLKENKEIIFEQAESCSNSMPYEDIEELAKTVGEAAFNMTATFSRMVNGEGKAREILDAVKQVVGKNTYDDIDEKCVPAKDVFDKFFKKYSKSFFGFSGGENVSTTLGNIKNDSYVKSNYPEAIRMISKAKELWDTPATVEPVDSRSNLEKAKANNFWNGIKAGAAAGAVKSGAKSGYKPCSGTYSYGCKSEVIAKVQGCLGGLVQDGKFGPKTKVKLSAKGLTTFTDSDVEKICKTEEKLGSDVENQTLGQNQNDVDSNTPSNPNQQDLTTKTGIS